MSFTLILCNLNTDGLTDEYQLSWQEIVFLFVCFFISSGYLFHMDLNFFDFLFISILSTLQTLFQK